jgi:UDP-glucose 4-epimerase
MGESSYPTKIIGTRHGEKRCETLLTREEMACAIDIDNYFRIPPDLRDLNYAKFISYGEQKITKAVEYNSDNTRQLDVKSMKKLLKKINFIQPLIQN